jgi:hypothetical protein
MSDGLLWVLLTRIRRGMQTWAIENLDPMFAHRHPGRALIFMVRLLSPLIRQLQPNDRWSLPAFVPGWLRILEQPSPPMRGVAKNIFIFCCYRGQFTLDLILALLLAWRGHKVVLGYLPKLRSPIKEPLQDSPGAAAYLHAVLSPIEALSGGRVRCVDLSDCIGKAPVRDKDYIEQQVHSDVVMKVRMERLDPDDGEVRAAFDFYRNVAENAQSAAWAWFEKAGNRFDLFLIANGASFEAAQFLHVAKSIGISVTSFEKFAFAKARTITHGAPFFSFDDLDVLFEEEHRIGLNQPDVRKSVCERAWQLLEQRRNSSGSAWGWQYQKSTRSLRDVELLDRLGLERERFVLVCPNVPFDAGYGAWLTIFPTMRDWLERSIRHLLAHSDLKIVVRAHPAECRPSFDREKVSKILADAGIDSERVVVIPGDSDVNTYDLMPLCRLGLVFASTTGVEIAMHGKPVIAGANVYYARCGVTLPANSEAEYFQQVERVVAGVEEDCGAFRPERAALVYALFHYNLQWPYPYDKPSQVVSMPLADFPKSPRIPEYVRTLDVLAMTSTEFREALPDVIDLRTNPWP